MRSGDIGDEAARSADDAELPLDLAAVRADDDLIEALSAGLVPPPSGPRDPSDVEGELVALLAGWVADVRPESLLHPPGSQPVAVQLISSSAAERAEADEPLAAVGSPARVRSLLEYEDAEPVTITRGRSGGTRGYLLRPRPGWWWSRSSGRARSRAPTTRIPATRCGWSPRSSSRPSRAPSRPPRPSAPR